MSSALEAENAVIGSILIDPSCMDVVQQILKTADFALEANRAIYQAAVKLRQDGRAVDPVLIKREIGESGGTISSEYMLQLMDITPTATNVEEYARLTRSASLRRAVLALGEEIKQKIEDMQDPQAVLSELACQAAQLQQDGSSSGLLTPQELMSRFYDHRIAVDSGTMAAQVPTGYRDLDDILGGGMLNSGMYILAARPGMGKTTFAINIADRVAQNVGPVLFVSLEMDDNQISAKRISRESGIPGNRILMDRLTDAENQRMMEAAEKIGSLPLSVNSKPTATVDDIMMLARKIKGLKLIVVDYLGKISPGERGNKVSRYEYTTEISGRMKDMARIFKVPVLLMCQLNREVDKRDDKKPQMSDLRDTGAAEQDADGVIFIYREAYYKKEAEKNPYEPEYGTIYVAKNRHGPTGECELMFKLAVSKVAAPNNDPRAAYKRSLRYR